MAAITPNWAATTSYTEGQMANLNGAVYRALAAITGAANNPSPDVDTTNWVIDHVVRITDYNSLIEAIRLELNDEVPDIERSVPFFIQMCEQSFQTRIRAPQMRRTRMIAVDANSRIRIPGDLLEVINLRTTGEVNTGSSIYARGNVEFKAVQNYAEYQETLQYYSRNTSFYDQVQGPATFPRYWFDDEYFYLAPEVDEGTMVELIYYGVIPQLGTTVSLTNEDGLPINSAGQTEAMWVAAGNSAASFVQATQTVTRNWFTQVAPQMLLYGSLVRAEAFLQDAPERIQFWRQMFQQAEAETTHLIEQFEDSRSVAQQLSSSYSN